MRTLLALVLAGGLALAQTFTSSPQGEGRPGEYVTLVFGVFGQGEVEAVVEAPPGWLSLTTRRALMLEGQGLLSLTVRVPGRALAGEVGGVRVRLLSQEQVLAEAQGEVRVLPVDALEVRVPEEIRGSQDAPLNFELIVSNRGNRPDTVRLRPVDPIWPVLLDPASLSLNPGESRPVRVTVVPQGQVSPGYLHVVRIEAASSNEAKVTRIVQAMARLGQAQAGAGKAAKDPRLTLTVQAGASARISQENGNWTGALSYSIAPKLGGTLSDYVSGEAQTNPLTGNEKDLLPDLPNTLGLSLSGEGWDARLGVSPASYDLGGSLKLGEWRSTLGGRLGAQGQGFGLTSTTVSLNPSLDLQVSAAVQRSSLYASDALGVRYRRPLGEGLVGGVGLDLFGGGSPYTVGAGLNQTLTWQAQNLDFLQSYSGIPAAGLHTLGLAGGTRSIYPLGVRGNTSLQVSPADTVWYNNLSLYSQAAPGVLLSLGGQYRQDRQSTTWGISPALGWSFLVPGIGYGGLSLSYGYTGVLAGSVPDGDLYQGSLSLGFDRGQLSLQARHERKGDQRTTEGQVGVRYTLAPYGFLEGRYTFALLPGGTERYTYGAFWENTWVGGLVSRLEYEQRLGIGSGGTHLERVAFGLRQRDFLSPGIVVGGVYGIQTDQGLFHPGATLTHTLSFSLGYELNWSFDTPRPVVDFFGGRKSGEVYGVVFQDRNLNGQQDPGEEGLEGLEVRLGRETARTDAQGRYRLVVPVGQYGVELSRGLAADQDLVGSPQVAVGLNTRQQLDLPVAPAVSLRLRLFDDLNNNGLPDPGEPGIPYGGILLEGLLNRSVRADVNGEALVSGVFAGEYLIRPDPKLLPSGYRATGDLLRLKVGAGSPPPPVAVGAALPPRQVETTFAGNQLAVLARVVDAFAVPGAEVEIQALVEGEPQRVVVHGEGLEAALERGENLWSGRIRLPLKTPPGLLRLEVQAQNALGKASSEVLLNVIAGSLFTFESAPASAKESTTLHFRLRFRPERAELLLPDASRIPLTSQDGYLWSAPYTAPEGPGPVEARLLADGEELGKVTIKSR